MDNENQENPPVKPKIEPLANASLASGLLAFIPICILPLIFAFSAIICGHISLSRISASGGTLVGRGRAICGLVTGYLLVVFFCIFMLFAIGCANEMAWLSNCTGDIKTDIVACQKYAEANQGQLPPNLETLQKAGLVVPGALTCPADRDNKAKVPSYLYFGTGLKLKDLDDKTILIAERERFHQKKRAFNIGFGDGHVELVTEPGDLATIARKNGWKLPGAGKNATNGTPPKAP
jgi:prepilin-type processing-associated H-X9-DG protein